MNNLYITLMTIQEDLSKYHRNKNELLEYYIQSRLNNSLQSYYHDLMNSLTYLKYKEKTRTQQKSIISEGS